MVSDSDRYSIVNVSAQDILQETKPRYDLRHEQLRILEKAMIAYVESVIPEPTSTALWVPASHPFANFVRTHEATYFPEVTEVSSHEDDNTLFLTVVDTRPNVQRVVHGATVMRSRLSGGTLDHLSNTGFHTVDSLIERGNFSLQEFVDFYGNRSVDLSRAVSVETNFRIGEKVADFNGLKPTDLAYVAIFELAVGEVGETENGRAAVFATINDLQADSFERIGLETGRLMDRDPNDFNTEESELGVHSAPIAIIYTKNCEQLFDELRRMMPALAMPEV